MASAKLTPITAAETKAQLEKVTTYKAGGEEAAGPGGKTLSITLTFAPGQTFSPLAVFEALDTAFTTVASKTAVVDPSNLNLEISA